MRRQTTISALTLAAVMGVATFAGSSAQARDGWPSSYSYPGYEDSYGHRYRDGYRHRYVHRYYDDGYRERRYRYHRDHWW